MSGFFRSESYRLSYLGLSQKSIMEILWDNGDMAYNALLDASRMPRIQARITVMLLKKKAYVQMVSGDNGEQVCRPAITRGEYDEVVAALLTMFVDADFESMQRIPREHLQQMHAELHAMIEGRKKASKEERYRTDEKDEKS